MAAEISAAATKVVDWLKFLDFNKYERLLIARMYFKVASDLPLQEIVDAIRFELTSTEIAELKKLLGRI